jgi:sugar lactone lactonase YvrE
MSIMRHATVAALALLAASTASAQPEIRALTGVIEGHLVGGVTADLVGDLYVADFGDTVWKITPEGERRVFASGLYGASGNAIDNDGNLLQANYYGDSITKVDRQGQAQVFAHTGLSGPVGIAIDRQTGAVYVANCRGNSIAKIVPNGTVSSFATSALFKCPNGIALDRDRNLYAVNFRDNKMLKIDPAGSVALFATVSQKGLGHLCLRGDRFYVTAYQSHEIYAVTLKGTVQRILGNGERGTVDGTAARRDSPFPMASPVIRGRSGSTSTRMSTTPSRRCRGVRSCARSFSTQTRADLPAASTTVETLRLGGVAAHRHVAPVPPASLGSVDEEPRTIGAVTESQALERQRQNVFHHPVRHHRSDQIEVGGIRAQFGDHTALVEVQIVGIDARDPMLAQQRERGCRGRSSGAETASRAAFREPSARAAAAGSLRAFLASTRRLFSGRSRTRIAHSSRRPYPSSQSRGV